MIKLCGAGTTEIKFSSLEYLGEITPTNEYLIDTTNEKNTALVKLELGGEITKRSFNLKLNENSELKLELNKELIVEFLKENQSVWAAEYVNKLMIDLEKGDYELNLFTEASTSENYQLLVNAIAFNIYEPIVSEPPFPQPKTLRKLGNSQETAFDFGNLKPWENDTNTGKVWNHGYFYPSDHLGHSQIEAQDSGWIKFTLDEPCFLNLYHNQTITKILNNNEVIISSNDYDGQIQTELEAGEYFLNVSSENSEEFRVVMYLSNSNPDYAD